MKANLIWTMRMCGTTTFTFNWQLFLSISNKNAKRMKSRIINAHSCTMSTLYIHNMERRVKNDKCSTFIYKSIQNVQCIFRYVEEDETTHTWEFKAHSLDFRKGKSINNKKKNIVSKRNCVCHQ